MRRMAMLVLVAVFVLALSVSALAGSQYDMWKGTFGASDDDFAGASGKLILNYDKESDSWMVNIILKGLPQPDTEGYPLYQVLYLGDQRAELGCFVPNPNGVGHFQLEGIDGSIIDPTSCHSSGPARFNIRMATEGCGNVENSGKMTTLDRRGGSLEPVGSNRMQD